MREEIAKILYPILSPFELPSAKGAKTTYAEDVDNIADQILSLPIGNSTLGEVIDTVPGLVQFISIWAVNNECDCSRCSPGIKAPTLPSGELLKVEEAKP